MNNIINDWKPETLAIVNALKVAGCTKLIANNGEYRSKLDEVGEAQFIEDLTACDEASLYATMPDGQRRGLFLVYGNSPGELICDYDVHPVLDKISDEHFAAWENRTQPTITKD